MAQKQDVMTKQESFKRRIRERMAKTGERYSAARRALLAQGPPPGRRRVWASEPEHSDDSIRAATGRGWDDWCDLIDAWPGHDDGHTAIAAWVHEREAGQLTHWWSQAVTVGYERITGRRVPYQRADGTFAAGRSRTLPLDAAELRAMLLDEQGRATLFPDLVTTLRSKSTSKAIRIGMEVGFVLFELSPTADGRVKVSLAHEDLPDAETCERWRFWWADWLDALEGAAST